MKKYYFIALITSATLAVVCLGGFSSVLSSWQQDRQVEFFQTAVTKVLGKGNVVFSSNNPFSFSSTRGHKSIGRSGVSKETRDLSVEVKDKETFKLEFVNADIQLKGSDQTTLKISPQNLSEDCEVILEESSDKIYAKLVKTGTNDLQGCEGSLNILLPRQLKTKISGGHGNITAEGLHGEMTFKMAAGDVMLTGMVGNVNGAMGAGNISIEGKMKELEAKSGTGNMDITFSEVLTGGEVDLKSGAGNITVHLPKGMKVKQSLKSGIGNIKSANQIDEQSNFELKVKSGVGDISVKEL